MDVVRRVVEVDVVEPVWAPALGLGPLLEVPRQRGEPLALAPVLLLLLLLLWLLAPRSCLWHRTVNGYEAMAGALPGAWIRSDPPLGRQRPPWECHPSGWTI